MLGMGAVVSLATIWSSSGAVLRQCLPAIEQRRETRFLMCLSDHKPRSLPAARDSLGTHLGRRNQPFSGRNRKPLLSFASSLLRPSLSTMIVGPHDRPFSGARDPGAGSGGMGQIEGKLEGSKNLTGGRAGASDFHHGVNQFLIIFRPCGEYILSLSVGLSRCRTHSFLIRFRGGTNGQDRRVD